MSAGFLVLRPCPVTRKWASIKHKKAASDARRGQLFTKLARAIAVAAREGGGDPEANFTLAAAMQKARDYSMPKDSIQRAIDRGAGGRGADDAIERVIYEGYGAGGVAILVEALTDNRNRTSADIRHAFDRQGGALGEPGSVAWVFDKRGVLMVDAGRYSEDDLIVAIDAGAEDVRVDGDSLKVVCAAEDLGAVREALEAADIADRVGRADHGAEDVVEVDATDGASLFRLMNALDEHDDVEAVHSNFDLPADVLEQSPERATKSRVARVDLPPRSRPEPAGSGAEGEQPAEWFFGRHPAAGPESLGVMVVLGIDPGVANTGFGVVSVDGPRMSAVDAGVITVPAGEPIETRLARIHEALTGLITRHQPVAMALEDVYFGRNVRSAIAVGQAGGSPSSARPRMACPASTTRRKWSRWPSAGAAPPPRTKSSEWWARCWAFHSPGPITPPTRWQSRSATRDTAPRPTGAAHPSARCRSRDCLGTRRGPRASPRPRGHRVGRGRLPARGLDRNLEARAGKRQGDHASRPSRGSRRLDGVIRVRQRGGARPLPAPHLRLGDRAEGGDRDPLRWAPRELLQAIAAGDAKRFQAAPGVGKRTSERLIVELREKVAGELSEAVAVGNPIESGDPRSLARDGLMHLGYTLSEAEHLLDGLGGDSAEELIAAGLRRAADSSGTRS